MIAIGASTWFLIQWTEYQTAKFADAGTRVTDAMSFLSYFEWKTEHMSFRFRGATDTGELGQAGYLVQSLQFLAFMIGGVAVYIILLCQRACSPCKKYFMRTVLLDAVDGSTLASYLQVRGVTLPNIFEGIKEKLNGRPFRGLSLSMDCCPSCQKQEIVVQVLVGKDDKEIVKIYICPTEIATKLSMSMNETKAVE